MALPERSSSGSFIAAGIDRIHLQGPLRIRWKEEQVRYQEEQRQLGRRRRVPVVRVSHVHQGVGIGESILRDSRKATTGVFPEGRQAQSHAQMFPREEATRGALYRGGGGRYDRRTTSGCEITV